MAPTKGKIDHNLTLTVQTDTKNSTIFFTTKEHLILASASPRRRRFLEELGLTFTIEAARVDELPLAHETPREFVLRAATDKARAVAQHNPDAWVLGADTVVVLDNQILGKPVDEGDAKRLLALLAGRWHEVLTGFCLCKKDMPHLAAHAVATAVKFVDFDETIGAAYVQTGEPLDKAGAYGIQGKGGFLVERINGSYSNVVGLPLAEVIEKLLQLEIIAPAPEPGRQ
jgi:septum formation protein